MKKALSVAILAVLASSASAEMIFRRGNGTEPQILDPQISEGVPESNIQRDLFEGLVAEDAAGELVPGLAKSWDISADGLVYTFHLQEQNWTDGSPFTAEDVVFALRRLVDPATGSKYSFIAYPIKNAKEITEGDVKDSSELGVKAIDAHTVEITLNAPTPYFLGLLTHSSTYPVPKAVVEKHGKEWTRPENIVSSGPFKMKDGVLESHITLEKSDTYWDKAAVKLDQVIFYPTEDQNSELKRYRAGELDWTNEIPNDQLKWIRENLAEELKIGDYLGTYYYGLNLSKAPFKDNLKLRQALSLAIDRNILTEKVTGAGEKAAYTIVPPGVMHYEHYVPEYASWPRDKQIAEAQRLYAEAGYGKDNPLKVELLYNTNENHKKIAVAVSGMWKQVLGVQTEMTNQEWKVYLQTRREKNTQIFRAGWIGDYNDPYTFLEMFQAGGGLNDVDFAQSEFDELLAQAAKEQDLDARGKILNQAEQMFTDDFAILPIYSYVSKRLVKPYVKGYEINIMDHSRSKYIYLEK